MAIVELQFRKQAFLDYFKADINCRRLPFSTLDHPLLPRVKDHLLEQIECVDCTVDPTVDEDEITLQIKLAIHFHTSFETIQAAGSLKRAVTEQEFFDVSLRVFVELISQPDQSRKAQLQWTSATGLFPPGKVPLDLPDGLEVQTAAVVASEDIIAIRLGTRIDDQVKAPITDRLGDSEWAQFVPGQLIADQLTANLAKTLESALTDDIELSKSPSGGWIPQNLPFFPWRAPFALAVAEVTAFDQCIFRIDISVSLTLVAEFEVSGHSMVTTLTLNWDADSTLCDVVGTVFGALLGAPILGIAIHVIAEDKASDTILGTAGPERFQKIGETDNSITYQSTSILNGPSGSFVLTHSEMNGDGLLVTGDIEIRPLPRGLEGIVSAPTSGLDRDCNARRVTVEFRPARLYVNDIGMDGPPRLFSPGLFFNPAGAWVAAPGASNDWLDLALTFVDPPGGRLPAGTATSVIINTDCGVRWVDLGVIPAEHAPPTNSDVAQMISQCMAINDPWGRGVMNLDWLVDPPNLLHEFDPVRQWTIGIMELPQNVHLEFVAVGPNGEKRNVGLVGGGQTIAAQITTNADETLQIITGDGMTTPAPVVFQRWIVPFASVDLNDDPIAVTAIGGMVGIRGNDGETQVVEIAAGGIANTRSLDSDQPQTDPSVDRLLAKMARHESRNRESWMDAAQVDRETVAVAHGQQLLIGRVGPMIKM